MRRRDVGGVEPDQVELSRRGGTSARLARVAKFREPFLQQLRGIIEAELRELPQTGSVLELGAGDGQLTAWLPQAIRQRSIHIEPFSEALAAFRHRHPELNSIAAQAGTLPFESRSLAGILGSCVLDIVRDLSEVVSECARTLKPGGRIIHFLDMCTHSEELFRALHAAEQVPLPNILFDGSREIWPQDLLVFPSTQLDSLVSLLKRGSPGAHIPLKKYLNVFQTKRFSVNRALAEYAALDESTENRTHLGNLFRLARRLDGVRQGRQDFQCASLSSSLYFAERLRREFSGSGQFTIEKCEVVRTRMILPRSVKEVAYRSLHVGVRRQLSTVPATQPGDEEMFVKPHECLHELGVFVFAARRCE